MYIRVDKYLGSKTYMCGDTKYESKNRI